MLLVISYPKPVRNRHATKWLIHFIYLEQHISVSDVEHNNLSDLEKFSKNFFFSFLKISFLVMFFSWSFVVFFVFFCDLLYFAATVFLFPVSYFLLPQPFFFCSDFFLFGHKHFSFAADISYMRWPISFFFHEHFSFAARIFLLPGAFSMPWPICLFAASIFLLLGAFFFCRDICGPP